MERVLEILADLREKLDSGETKLIEDLNYCIKVISANELYEAKIDLENANFNDKQKGDALMFLRNYSVG